MTGQEPQREVAATIGVTELVGGHAFVPVVDPTRDGALDALEVGMVVDLRDDAGHVFSAKVVDQVAGRWQLALQA